MTASTVRATPFLRRELGIFGILAEIPPKTVALPSGGRATTARNVSLLLQVLQKSESQKMGRGDNGGRSYRCVVELAEGYCETEARVA